MCRLAGRAVAEAGDGAVVGGGGHQPGHRHHVRAGRLRLPSLKETTRVKNPERRDGESPPCRKPRE